MKKIGLLGGMSWESTAEYYRLINREVGRRLGGLHSARLAPAIEGAVAIPLLHLADATARAVVDAGVRRVGLLGTAFTMEQDFYVDRLRTHGLDVLTPDAVGRADVHRIIYDELCHGDIRDSSRTRYAAVIGDLVTAGAEGVILGCTEIELLVDPDGPSPVPLFPTTRLHALAAVEFALAP